MPQILDEVLLHGAAVEIVSRDATPRNTIPALFVGVAMTVEHISSEVSVFAFRGKGDSTGGRAQDLSS